MIDAPTIAPLGIDNVLFTAGDLDAAVAFYEGVLGLRLRFRLPDPPIALFAIGEETPRVLIRLGETAPPPGQPRLWLEVADARRAAAALASAGVTLLATPFRTATGWTVEVADPWGNVVGLAAAAARPELGRQRRGDG